MNSTRFRFDLPNGWEDQTVYSFRGPQDAGKEHLLTLVLNRNLQHDDIAGFAREYIDAITASLQSVEVLKDEEVTIENGNQTHEFVYKWIPAQGLVTYTKYVFIIREDLGYVFSCEFTKRTYKAIGPMMKEVIDAIVPGTYEPLEA